MQNWIRKNKRLLLLAIPLLVGLGITGVLLSGTFQQKQNQIERAGKLADQFYTLKSESPSDDLSAKLMERNRELMTRRDRFIKRSAFRFPDPPEKEEIHLQPEIHLKKERESTVADLTSKLTEAGIELEGMNLQPELFIPGGTENTGTGSGEEDISDSEFYRQLRVLHLIRHLIQTISSATGTSTIRSIVIEQMDGDRKKRILDQVFPMGLQTYPVRVEWTGTPRSMARILYRFQDAEEFVKLYEGTIESLDVGPGSLQVRARTTVLALGPPGKKYIQRRGRTDDPDRSSEDQEESDETGEDDSDSFPFYEKR